MNIDNGMIGIMQNNVQNSLFDKIMPVITSIGGFEIWILIALALIFTKKYRKQGIVLIITLGVCIVLGSFCIKSIVKRIRPCDVYDYLNLISSICNVQNLINLYNSNPLESFRIDSSLYNLDERVLYGLQVGVEILQGVGWSLGTRTSKSSKLAGITLKSYEIVLALEVVELSHLLI